MQTHSHLSVQSSDIEMIEIRYSDIMEWYAVRKVMRWFRN